MEAAARAQPIEFERIGRVPAALLRLAFRREGIARELPTRYGIVLYRLVYGTINPDGRPTAASGLVALPRGVRAPRAVVSWQHGTTSLRTDAPSNKHVFNGILPAAVFAGHGHVLLAPDYYGMGVSPDGQLYFVTDHMAAVLVDFVTAARRALLGERVAVPDDLLLSGFSQGGHATLALYRAIERVPIDGFTLRASAPIAAPVDLRTAGLAGAFANGSRYCSLYLAWLAVSYARVYDEPLDSVFTREWAAIAPTLFDGLHDDDATVAALPTDARALVQPDLVAAFEHAQPHWFLDRLAENSLLDWNPVAPVRAYFGEADADVVTAHAEAIRNRLATDANDVRVISVGDVDHEAVPARAAPQVRAWFDELLGH